MFLVDVYLYIIYMKRIKSGNKSKNSLLKFTKERKKKV